VYPVRRAVKRYGSNMDELFDCIAEWKYLRVSDLLFIAVRSEVITVQQRDGSHKGRLKIFAPSLIGTRG
jgi:hypothetical protein